VGLEEAWSMCCEDNNKRQDSLTLWPAAAVAAKVCSSNIMNIEEKNRDHHQQQHSCYAFATLPTPIQTGYPVHVNARWCLSDNRNALLGVNDSASQRVEQRWNLCLIKDAIASLWIELLQNLQAINLSETDYYNLFPRHDQVFSKKLWRDIMSQFYIKASSCKLLRSSCVPSRYLTISEARFEHTLIPLPTDSRDERRSWLSHVLRKRWKECHKKRTLRRTVKMYLSWIRDERGAILTSLRRIQVPFLVSAPRAIYNEFRVFKLGSEMTPDVVRRILRCVPLHKLSTSSCFFKWCTQDLDPQRLGDLGHIIGLPVEVMTRRRGKESKITTELVRIGTKIRTIFAGFYEFHSKCSFSSITSTSSSSSSSFCWLAAPTKKMSSEKYTLLNNQTMHGWLPHFKRVSSEVILQNGKELIIRDTTNHNGFEFYSTDKIKSIYIQPLNSSNYDIYISPTSATLEICSKLLPNERFATQSSLNDLLSWSSNCGDSLNLIKFSAQTLSHFLHKILPPEWKNKDFVRVSVVVSNILGRVQEDDTTLNTSSSSSNSSKIHSGPKKKRYFQDAKTLDMNLRKLSRNNNINNNNKIKNLYKFLKLTTTTTTFLKDKSISSWPLIPCITNGYESILISPRLENLILRHPFDGSGKTRELTHLESKVWNILTVLGIPLLNDEEFDLPYDILTKELNVVNMVHTLIEFEQSELCLTGMNSLTAQQRFQILSYIESAAVELSKDILNKIKNMCLFQTVKKQFTKIVSDITYCTLPITTTPQARDLFLKFQTSTNLGILHANMLDVAPKLIKRLHITSLSMANYFIQFIFPNVQNMSRRNILECVECVQLQYRDLCSSNKDFENVILRLRWIECEDGVWRSARELFDPTVSLFSSYFEKSLFPPSWIPRHLLDFLRNSLELRTNMDAVRILYLFSLIFLFTNHTHSHTCRMLCCNVLTKLQELETRVDVRKF
jgi:hypothetical protein